MANQARIAQGDNFNKGPRIRSVPGNNVKVKAKSRLRTRKKGFVG